MQKLARVVLTFVLVAVVAAPLMAQEGKKKKKKGKKQGGGAQAFAFQLPKAVTETLTDEQKKSIGDLRKEYAPKLREINMKRTKIVSREKLQAANKARQEARKNGTKGAELQKVFQDALGLNDEQKKEMAAVNKEQQTLNQEIRGKLLKLLTDEQKEKLPKPKAKKKGGKKKKKKNADN